MSGILFATKLLLSHVGRIFEATGNVDRENETLISIEFYTTTNGRLTVIGYFHPIGTSTTGGIIPSLDQQLGRQSGAIHVRKVEVDITIDEFFAYFKRFNVVLVHRGLDLIGRQFEYED